MPVFHIDDDNGLFYRHTAPTAPDGITFVFFNALTGDTGMWEGVIGKTLRNSGHGTLSFNFRGQSDSPFSPLISLNADLIIEDSLRLMSEINPVRPVLAGLSIGGLFAARTWLRGRHTFDCPGLVLINTLRQDGPRLRWINDALVRCAEVGGLDLFRDLYAPLIFNEDWQVENRKKFLTDTSYLPLPKSSGHYNLLKNAGSADWDIPYEEITLPVLLITGLQDRVFLDHRDVTELGARIPRAERVDMANAAHLLPAERPAELAELLLQFTARI